MSAGHRCMAEPGGGGSGGTCPHKVLCGSHCPHKIISAPGQVHVASAQLRRL